MKTSVNLQYLSGSKAYKIYREQFYGNQVRLSSVMAIDLNLEILINKDGILMAFRHDCPKDMKGMIKDEGKWRYLHGKNLSCSNLLTAFTKQTFCMILKIH